MANEAKMGVLAKLGTNASGNNASEPFVFQSEDVRKTGTILERAGIRGTRAHTSLDTRSGPYSVGGTLLLEPTPADLTLWLPRIFGANYALSEDIPSFTLQVDRITKVFAYTECKVAKATFSASVGDPILKLALEIAGKTEIVTNAGTFPALNITDTAPYIFSDVALTLQNTTRQVSAFSLVVDNHLVLDRFMNTVTRTDLPPEDRTISLQTSHGYTAENADLYAQALAGAAGLLKFTNGAQNTSFNFSILQVADESPTVNSKAEVPLVLNMIARRATGSTVELTIVHTP